MFVPRLTAADVQDLFNLRIALETDAARRVVEARADVTGMESALLDMEAITGEQPWDEIVDIDLRFHRELIDAIDSPRMRRTFASLQSELRLLLAQMKPHYDRPDQLGAEHRIVYDAVAGQRPATAVKRVREHLELGVEDILNTIS